MGYNLEIFKVISGIFCRRAKYALHTNIIAFFCTKVLLKICQRALSQVPIQVQYKFVGYVKPNFLKSQDSSLFNMHILLFYYTSLSMCLRVLHINTLICTAVIFHYMFSWQPAVIHNVPTNNDEITRIHSALK